MADRYAKKPIVRRFQSKETYAGRSVKRTVLERRNRPGTQGRKMKPMKPMKKGR